MVRAYFGATEMTQARYSPRYLLVLPVGRWMRGSMMWPKSHIPTKCLEQGKLGRTRSPFVVSVLPQELAGKGELEVICTLTSQQLRVKA
jgi:hypothetical protein